MTPIRNDLTNLVLGAPVDWNEAEQGVCRGLPVHHAGDHIYSWWAPTWRERVAVLFGKPVRLCVASNRHPPVHIDTFER